MVKEKKKGTAATPKKGNGPVGKQIQKPKRQATARAPAGKKQTSKDRGAQLDAAEAFCKEKGYGAVKGLRIASEAGLKYVPIKKLSPYTASYRHTKGPPTLLPARAGPSMSTDCLLTVHHHRRRHRRRRSSCCRPGPSLPRHFLQLWHRLSLKPLELSHHLRLKDGQVTLICALTVTLPITPACRWPFPTGTVKEGALADRLSTLTDLNGDMLRAWGSVTITKRDVREARERDKREQEDGGGDGDGDGGGGGEDDDEEEDEDAGGYLDM